MRNQGTLCPGSPFPRLLSEEGHVDQRLWNVAEHVPYALVGSPLLAKEADIHLTVRNLICLLILLNLILITAFFVGGEEAGISGTDLQAPQSIQEGR